MKRLFFLTLVATGIISLNSCNSEKNKQESKTQDTTETIKDKVSQFAEVTLTTDISKLTDKEKQMLPLLFEAAQIMDDIYWQQSYGDKKELLSNITDEDNKRFVEINYGPWERLNNNKSFIDGIGEKPAGANFYPKDITKEEFEKFNDKTKQSLYTIIRRKADGSLESIPYNIAYKEQIIKASDLIKKASELAEDKGLKKYLQLRAEALLTDNYQPSDMAWMDMKTNTIDFVVGPIENYEDGLYGYKAAQEAFILIKDKEWSKKLDKYLSLLPGLQKELPSDAKYLTEVPGSNSDLGVYDAIFYAGDCNSGSKTIAINLPNDEVVQLKKGARRLQLKNTMKAKFDNILMPISNQLISKNEISYVSFEAFFNNVMFHEIAHGLGIKNTINKKGTVKDALKETYNSIEECKADILGVFLVSKLFEKGIITEGEIKNNYVTFIAGIFRSVRFGASSAHGKSNMIQFNTFIEKGAIKLNEDGTYAIDFDKMKDAISYLGNQILTIQGEGDYDAAKKLIETKSVVPQELQNALNNINNAKIPVDVVFKQGKDVIGL
ncbi:MAG: Zn-dependent hydrolase [Bacteroidetes bacterium GWE2_29_8]|nr:MAG: Zn-dependent hydrolase [Bacteroidetes bacterium GWE2_29_8]